MKKTAALLFLCLCFIPVGARAQNAAPELFGVKEVVIEYVHFDDPEAADTCGLSRDQVVSALTKAFASTTVPAVPVAEARPTISGIARIQLVPEISSHVDESLGCVSWISLSAESHAKLSIPPINTLRGLTVIYWRQHVKVASGQSIHEQRVTEALQKMAAMFAQQYRLDQPPDIPQ